MMPRLLLLAFLAAFGAALLYVALTASPPEEAESGSDIADAGAVAAALGSGVNFGDVLEAPTDSPWRIQLSDELFEATRAAGFKTIRLPVRFSSHAGVDAPYLLDERLMERVDFAVEQALKNDLRIVIDAHHYRQLDGDPPESTDPILELDDAQIRERFIAIWSQVAERYADQPNELVLFELYNEPHGKLTPDVWNQLFARTLAEIRTTNPSRYVVVGPSEWYRASGLARLVLPPDDRRLIVAIHGYEPFNFTHQGADWVAGSDAWLGTRCCNETQRAEIVAPLDIAAAWSKATNRPIWLGEFGAQDQAAYADRVTYTGFVREQAERRGFSWAYWNLASRNFGLYRPGVRIWNTELVESLLPGTKVAIH